MKVQVWRKRQVFLKKVLDSTKYLCSKSATHCNWSNNSPRNQAKQRLFLYLAVRLQVTNKSFSSTHTQIVFSNTLPNAKNSTKLLRCPKRKYKYMESHFNFHFLCVFWAFQVKLHFNSRYHPNKRMRRFSRTDKQIKLMMKTVYVATSLTLNILIWW